MRKPAAAVSLRSFQMWSARVRVWELKSCSREVKCTLYECIGISAWRRMNFFRCQSNRFLVPLTRSFPRLNSLCGQYRRRRWFTETDDNPGRRKCGDKWIRFASSARAQKNISVGSLWLCWIKCHPTGFSVRFDVFLPFFRGDTREKVFAFRQDESAMCAHAGAVCSDFSLYTWITAWWVMSRWKFTRFCLCLRPSRKLNFWPDFARAKTYSFG